MTKKQFKYDMQRGLGSCLVELNRTQDLDSYKDIILWGCRHNLAYDTQCEGSRSYYLYQMIQLYEDWYPFYEAIALRIDRCCTSWDWEFSQHAELLALMANGGYQPAVEKLKDIYQHLLTLLMNRKKFPRHGDFAERENMELLCIAFLTYLYDDIELLKREYIKIVNDLGSLFKKNPKLYSFWNFEWFEDHCQDVIGKKTAEKLLKENDFQPGIKSYLESKEQCYKKEQEKSNNQSNLASFYSAENIYNKLKKGAKVGAGLPRLSPLYLRNPKNKEETKKLSDIYAKEEDAAIRIQLLKLLRKNFKADSENIEKLIGDSKSENEVLSEMAFEVLCYVKDDKVHQYALELLKEGSAGDYPLLMLLCNYTQRESDMIIRLVKEVPITEDSGWHSIFWAVEDLFRDKDVKKPPKELLSYMYRNTLCSCCRRGIVAEMGRRRMLTKEILEECSFDSNGDIREYAYGKLQKK